MPPQDSQNFQPAPVGQQPAPQNNQLQPEESNTIAVVGFVLAFFVPLAGLICSIIGLKKSKSLAGKNRGLALAGVILSTVFMLLTFIYIIVIVLIATPALQGNARDTARLSDIASLRGQVEVWKSNNTGRLPATSQDLNDIIDSVGWGHYGVFHGKPDATVQHAATPVGTVKEDVVIMFTSSVTDEDINAITLPHRDAIHIWLGRSCESESLANGNRYLSDDNTYAAGDLTSSTPAGSIAYVYQLEREDKASCQDSTGASVGPRTEPDTETESSQLDETEEITTPEQASDSIAVDETLKAEMRAISSRLKASKQDMTDILEEADLETYELAEWFRGVDDTIDLLDNQLDRLELLSSEEILAWKQEIEVSETIISESQCLDSDWECIKDTLNRWGREVSLLHEKYGLIN